MKYLLFVFAFVGLISCGNSGSGSGSGDYSSYTSEDAPGSNAQKIYKKTADGTLVEEGYIVGGRRNGMWLTFHDNERIKTLASYSDDQLNGPTLEYNNRGQLEKKTTYLGGKLNGLTASYKFGRPTIETNYVNGEINGTHIEYNGKGDIQKYVEFKNGKQHGTLRYYDEEGNITLEYEYKNGEKVSGGIVNSGDSSSE